jgi:hypothetical protein
VKVDVVIEQLLAAKLDAVRDADVADGATRAGGTDRLHHRLPRADAFQYCRLVLNDTQVIAKVKVLKRVHNMFDSKASGNS